MSILIVSVAGCATKEAISPFFIRTGGKWDSQTEFRLNDCGPLRNSSGSGTGYMIGMIASGVLGLKILTGSGDSNTQLLGLGLLGAGGYLYYLWSSENQTFHARAIGDYHESDVTLSGCVIEFPYRPDSRCRFITLHFENGSTIAVDLKDPIF